MDRWIAGSLDRRIGGSADPGRQARCGQDQTIQLIAAVGVLSILARAELVQGRFFASEAPRQDKRRDIAVTLRLPVIGGTVLADPVPQWAARPADDPREDPPVLGMMNLQGDGACGPG